MAETAKHTPGPWSYKANGMQYVGGGTYSPRFVIPEAKAKLHGNEANARLIAAAPDLYSAVSKLLAELAGISGFKPEIQALVGNTNWAVLERRVQEARAAIAKAAA